MELSVAERVGKINQKSERRKKLENFKQIYNFTMGRQLDKSSISYNMTLKSPI